MKGEGKLKKEEGNPVLMSAANIHVTSVYVFLENYLYTDKTKGGFFQKILNMKPHTSYTERESNKNCPGKLSVKAKL